MGSAFHPMCPRYSGPLNPPAPMVARLWAIPFILFKINTGCLKPAKAVIMLVRRGGGSDFDMH